MKPKPTYVVLVANGRTWQPHGPVAVEHATLKQAEAAAEELSVRYPQRVLAVYELRSVFATEQKVVKESVELPREKLKRRAASVAPAENVVGIRAVG